MNSLKCALALAGSALALAAAPAEAAISFGFADLGSLDPGGSSSAYGVNDAGRVVGVSSYAGPYRHAFQLFVQQQRERHQ